MPVLKAASTSMTHVREGVSRRLVHGDNLMLVVIEFSGGPWAEPEPLHDHIHEQASYVAAGEIRFFCEGEETQTLSSGDMFRVLSGKKHGIQLLSKRATLVDAFNPIRKDFL